ncbi:MAG: F0F1 ATP synthase subunit gamma [Candidatus Omnitrophica bacterium]|nr:F0F1 ATP synthase subunit gamma [Candidatus Omnitrophota bacterium]MDD5477078.1 F0F1 ATP synthase subunit gamma [Candidatus Omnitrophota bacterium]
MRTLSNIKKDIEFNQGHASLIEALKNIAVAQFKIHEQKLKLFEKIILTAEDFFKLINIDNVNCPFLSPQKGLLGVVVVTSDSGLLGGLNLKVINQALLELEKTPGKLIVIGACGKNYLRETKFSFVSFDGINDEQRYLQAMQLRDYCLAKVAEGVFGSLKVVYPHPISFTVQRVETLTFLPFVPPQKSNVPAGDLILESSLADIVQYLISVWIGQKFYDIFGLSRLSEFAARFVHLEESSQKLKDIEKNLKLQYFRVRHEFIDRSMRELFSARLLYT